MLQPSDIGSRRTTNSHAWRGGPNTTKIPSKIPSAFMGIWIRTSRVPNLSLFLKLGHHPNSTTLDTIVTGFAAPPTGLVVTAGQSLQFPLTLYAQAGSGLNFM